MKPKLPKWVQAAQAQWKYRGQEKPSFAITPNPGQESVWDYPRPPQLLADDRHVVIRANGIIIAESQSTYRILETASPPTFYIPPDQVDTQSLALQDLFSHCEWKGMAQYWCLYMDGLNLLDVAWSYLNPYPDFKLIAGYIAFHPRQVTCYVDEELVEPQPGDTYGGWITKEIVGPFKGETGTESW